jgi:central kinetochore subunit Mis15/CHL4
MAPSRAPPKANLALPSFEPLPPSLRLPSTHPTVLKTFSPLSRPSLLALAAEWCSPENVATCGPYVNPDGSPDDPECPWTAATSVDEVRELYDGLASRKGSKRELLDRLLEGDWRAGVSLQQLAMADAAALAQHPSSRRWTAYAITHPPSATQKSSRPPARIHPNAFLLALHTEIAPLAKVHYRVWRPAAHPLTLVRLCLFSTPYSPSAAASLTADPALLATPPRVILLAFPDAAPFIYVSFPQAGSSKRSSGSNASSSETAATIDAFVLAALAPALSRPGRPRCSVAPAALAARSLGAMLAARGAAAPTSGASGAFSLLAAPECLATPLDFGQRGGAGEVVRRAGEESDADGEAGDAGDDDGDRGGDGAEAEEPKKAAKPRGRRAAAAGKRPFAHADPTAALPVPKRRALRRAAAARFGTAGALPPPAADAGDAEAAAAGLDRVSLRLLDGLEPAPKNGKGRKMDVRVSFAGSHVFAGVRRLVEAGVVDGARMPAWLTGEANSSMGVVEGGKMEAWDGLVD